MVNMSSAGREQAEPKLFGRIHNVVIFIYIYIYRDREVNVVIRDCVTKQGEYIRYLNN